MIVATAMAAVIGLLVIKPWAAPDSEEPISPSADSPVAAESPSVRTLPSTVPIGAQPPISLGELRSRAEASSAPPSDRGAVFGTTFDLVYIPYVAAAPHSTELGSDCTGGAMLGEGNEAIAVRFEERNVRFFRVDRLFDSRPAVRMPVITTETATDGAVLTTELETAWPVGHYSMTIWARRSERVLPFCIGRKIRLVDYSLVSFVPQAVDDPGARAALVAEIAGR